MGRMIVTYDNVGVQLWDRDVEECAGQFSAINPPAQTMMLTEAHAVAMGLQKGQDIEVFLGVRDFKCADSLPGRLFCLMDLPDVEVVLDADDLGDLAVAEEDGGQA